MHSLILYCCSCSALAYTNDVCLILFVPPLEQYRFFGAIASIPVVLSVLKQIYLVVVLRIRKYITENSTAAMLEMVASMVILGDAKRHLLCLYYWLNWAKYHHSVS